MFPWKKYISESEYLKNRFKTWTGGNKRIDAFIQEMQLNVDIYFNNMVLEKISYNQFDQIKETSKNGLMTVYSANMEG
jgi:hypothetical protein